MAAILCVLFPSGLLLGDKILPLSDLLTGSGVRMSHLKVNLNIE